MEFLIPKPMPSRELTGGSSVDESVIEYSQLLCSYASDGFWHT